MGHTQHSDRPPRADEEGVVSTRASSSSGEVGADERRLSGRYDVTWPVDCEGEDTFLYAAIANISAMGIFVRTTDPLAVGSELTLRFTPRADASHALDGEAASSGTPAPGEPFVLRGAVQWVNRDVGGSPNPGMGVRFIDLTLDDRERIVEVIRTIAYLREDPSASD